ncbi:MULTISPECIES: type II secretion system F family protein [unclassified Mesorhizobium]|uniref:type II secretion system F family protein n=1 Tax=unclassified Mesorhizobium TaxID=325217 RepID=UPI000FD440F5|nr:MULTISPECIES: type II secretion system F family protein [unclassified Mesorhizobium]AZV18013.1 type II secretion system F family protein [Mesorhizobium sp. M7A.F.Ce.TU.012.03.2.1]RUU92943.1 type II secretion system F family protein [Mesorhizobium sp. M7A.F.Ca.MR.176.00.0.0]RVD10906.1 type II secretion system F family protein [Mesorhizobium sp. M7A.F.Ca.ET.027.02.1.1]RWD10130.1 MAG: type II secretion system F family protein [Mesorhizobium sp.]RWO88798.1 MAG: type II secretion system F family
MFGIDGTVLAFVVLAGFSAGAVAYAFLFTRISNEKQVGKRLETIRTAETDRSVVKASRDRVAEAVKRRKSVQDSLNELDAKQKTKDSRVKKPPLKAQLRQAGLKTTIERFYIYSAVCGIVLTIVAFVAGAPLIALPGVLLAGGLGLPRWFVTFRRARRVKAFLNEFPNALDIIVRAVKSGLPLNDAVRLIANESPEPVKTEFRRIVDSQQMGLSIPDATLRMPETMPCTEASFFGIVIQIQSQAGGNLSEALGNLSRVLRDRKKMKAKVAALSMEAKASAAIIGALPFIVAFLVYLSSPAYLMPLFNTSVGNLILGCSAVWMSIGILVMRKMMNFEV